MRIHSRFFFLFFLLSSRLIAQDFISDSLPVNLGKNINTKHPELAPMISPEGQTLYFSRDHYEKHVEKTSRKTYHMILVEYQTIYSSKLDSSGAWKPAKKMKDEMNSSEFNALCSISPDGNSILVYKFPKLFISKRNGKDWGELIEQKMDNFYDSSSFCNFYLSNDGKFLISAVTRQQKRKEDVFVSFLLGPNHWSAPRNLGPAINSFGREISPFLAADNRTIYFSSNGWGGLGEMDIYVSHRHDSSWTDWSPPRNLGAPINTPGWDAYFSIPASGDEAYYVSTQSGFGEEDIFKVKVPEWAKPHRVVELKGIVTDAETGRPLIAEVIINNQENESETAVIFSDSIGEFRNIIHIKEDYIMTIKVLGFIEQQTEFNVNSDSILNIRMQRIKIVCSYTVQNVLFKSGSYEIDKFQALELSRTANFLIVNPDLNMEVIGYTDASGKKRYNKKLSFLRANRVKEFLIARGVAKDRIVVTAKGQEFPIMPNDTEEGKRINRRVELNMTQGKK